MTRFAGRPIEEFDPAKGLRNPARVAYRITRDWSSQRTALERLEDLVRTPGAERLQALVISNAWLNSPNERELGRFYQLMQRSAPKLPKLSALFIGDVTSQDCEISWMAQQDLTPLLLAYPNLRHLGVRGALGLRLEKSPTLPALRALQVESGGLTRSFLDDLWKAKAPLLSSLELWLGSHYHGDAQLSDLAPLFQGARLPSLRYLGLRNSEYADDIAQQLATSKLMEQIKVLDLSMGSLGDVGLEALLRCEAVGRLEALLFSSSGSSEEMVARLRSRFPLLSVYCEEQNLGERYCTVAE